MAQSTLFSVGYQQAISMHSNNALDNCAAAMVDARALINRRHVLEKGARSALIGEVPRAPKGSVTTRQHSRRVRCCIHYLERCDVFRNNASVVFSRLLASLTCFNPHVRRTGSAK